MKRNKSKYDEERLREWRERKLMNDEDVRLRSLYTREEADKEDKMMKEEAKELREKEMDE